MIHKNSIKEIIIKEYLNTHKKAPTQQEMKSFYNEYLLNNPNVDSNGISATSNTNYPVASKNSSASQINTLSDNIYYDMQSINSQIKTQREYLENLFRNSYQQEESILKDLRTIERNINKNLLLMSKDDIFSYGIVEDFENYDKVDFQNSNIYFFNGKATVNLDSLKIEETTSYDISYQVSSKSGSLTQQKTINNISAAKYEDGNFFKIIANSTYPVDLMECMITLDFQKEDSKYIDTVKFVTNAIEVNSKMSYRCFYTKDMVNFNEVFESNLRITENENFVEINEEEVKQVRLILSKNKYDYEDGAEYSYVFSLDFIGLLEKTFKTNTSSTLLLGPYEILDEDEKPVNFSMASLKGGTCCIVPDKSSVDFYLSKDNLTWIPASFHNSHKEVVQFNQIESSLFDDSLFEVIDSTSNNLYIADEIPNFIDLKSNEALINYKIPISKKENFIKKTLTFKRNIFSRNIKEKIYNANSGWYRDDQDNIITYINIKQPEGRYINFGNTSCYLNSRLVTGKVFIPFGIHEFKTSILNYTEIPNIDDIKNAAQLKQQDKKYPYNHKYLIEGYPYKRDFIGKRVYYGVDELFSFLLEEVSNQKFEVDNSLNIFTILETEEGLFFKIKTNDNSGENKLEMFNIECKKRNNIVDGNNLYIKAVLKTFDLKVTPKIDQVQVRVI